MQGIPELSDGAIDPVILEARENCNISRRITHKNWKVRKDVYDEISNSLDSLDNSLINEQISLYMIISFYFLLKYPRNHCCFLSSS